MTGPLQVAVDKVNSYRALHSAAALTVSPALESYAQSWANKGQFVHSYGAYGTACLFLPMSKPAATILSGHPKQGSMADPTPKYHVAISVDRIPLGLQLLSCGLMLPLGTAASIMLPKGVDLSVLF